MAGLGGLRGRVQVRVAVVGGGVAGLAAAARLAEGGVTDYLLLEARHRLGGRVHTVPHGSGVLDLGAQYVHGVKGNPIYEIAAKLDQIVSNAHAIDIKPEQSDDGDDFHKINTFYMADGQVISPDIVKEVREVIGETLEECAQFSRKQLPNREGHSLGSYLHTHFQRYLDRCSDPAALRRQKEGVFNWWLLWENGDNACASTDSLSLEGWGDYVSYEGAKELELKRGFQPILDDITKRLDEAKVKVGVPVKAIYWDRAWRSGCNGHTGCTGCAGYTSGTGHTGCAGHAGCTGHTGCTSHTDSAGHTGCAGHTSCTGHTGCAGHTSCAGCTYDKCTLTAPESSGVASVGGGHVVLLTEGGAVVTADHVIVTVPLGYLQAHAHALFRPLLPNDKLRAIHRIGFGTVDKIYLEFPFAFWSPGSFGIRFAWLGEEAFILEGVQNPAYLQLNWFRAIEGFTTIAGQPLMLEGWVAGQEACVMESIPDHVVSHVCHELLTRFMGRSDVPKPLSIKRTCWYRDQYARGSYIHLRQGYTSADCDTLATPLPSEENPHLLFAGEATHSTFFSTVHGALLSGKREASRILQHLKNTTSPSRTKAAQPGQTNSHCACSLNHVGQLNIAG